MRRIDVLKYIHKGETCYIVGTGPSIGKLTAADFADGFVIAINSAISMIESLDLAIPVYSQYKDGNYPEQQCTFVTCENCVKGQPAPVRATLLLHFYHAFNCFPDYEPKYYFSNPYYGLAVNDFSQKSAIRNAELMGAANLVFYGFDSITPGDCSKFTGQIDNSHTKKAEQMKVFDYRLPYIYK
jgi:hypothetical protein